MTAVSVHLRKGYILREYAGEFCVFHTGRTDEGAIRDIPSLNPDAVFLWSLLERGETSPAVLAERLAAQNDTAAEDVEPDVQEFLARLIHAGIAVLE